MNLVDQQWRTTRRPAPSTPAPDVPPIFDVVVADDSEIVRAHLVALLEATDGIRVVGQADDTPRLLEMVDALRPHVVVLDISMPGGNGIKALQHIKAAHPDTRVVMLTNHSNEFYRKKCMSTGAAFFLDKSSEFERIGEVIAMLMA